MPYNSRVFSFIEARIVAKLVVGCLTDDEY
jgi:hypothetical protein